MERAVMHLGFDGRTLCGAVFRLESTTDKPEDTDCNVCAFVIEELRSGRKRTLPRTRQQENEEEEGEILRAEDLTGDLGLSAVTIRKLWKNGAIPCVKTKGNRLGMSRALYDGWREKCRAGGWPKEMSIQWTTDRGTVYFVQAEGDPLSPVKIGFTSGKTVTNRLKTLQTSHPHRLIVLATVPGSMKTEQDLHSRFAADRMQGEWFRASVKLLEWISGLKTR